jgi:outer membrane protein W
VNVRVLTAALAVAILAGPVSADRFLELSTGVGLTKDSELRLRQSDSFGDTNLRIRNVAWDDNSLTGPSARYLNLRFAYFLKSRPWLGFGVELLHYKVFAEVDRVAHVQGINQGTPIDAVQPIDDIVQQYVVSNGVNLIPFSMFARLRARRSERFPNGTVQPYLGLGAGPTLLFTQSAVNGEFRPGKYEFGNPAFQAVAGARFRLSPRWSFLTEYKYTYTEANGPIAAGTSRTDLHSNHLTVGAGFRF